MTSSANFKMMNYKLHSVKISLFFIIQIDVFEFFSKSISIQHVINLSEKLEIFLQD